MKPRDLATNIRKRQVRSQLGADGFVRDTFKLPRDAARAQARDFLSKYPVTAYMTIIESWRQLADGRIEFTMRRLPSAD